ncbi:MAG: glycosyltransferase family 2 protein [Lentisphaeria bacterium]|nr:glycosyltransferase family 2 protein [Lentisphaeria bacterium]
MLERPKISAYMLTRDNIRTVENALRSIAWVDEIVVVDSGSADGTLEIVRRHASRVIERPWPGFRDQYQFAADACAHDWALFIDADEVIPDELAAEINERLTENAGRDNASQTAGYIAPRRTWYIDRWIKYGAWKSDREVRLYKRSLGEWKGGLHACVHVDGPVETLRNAYQHYTYADVADHVNTINRYSTTGAEDMAAAGKTTSPGRAFWGGIGRFSRDYILKRGFLDGFPGLIIAVGSAYNSFLKHAKLTELKLRQKKDS